MTWASFKASLALAWAWVQKNWKWLLFPVGIALFLWGRYSRSPEVVHIDPVEAADDRERVEVARRLSELSEERQRLLAEIEAIKAQNAKKLDSLSEEQRAHVKELESDPEALNTWLRSL